MLGVFIPTNALVKNTKVTQLSCMLKQKIVKKNYCCPVKLFETIKIRAEYLAWYSALVVTFVFA